MENKNPKFSVVFVSWNGGKAVERAVSSVLAGGYDNLEVIVVDNNSSDDTVDRLESSFEHLESVRIIQNQRNYGFSIGMNRGIQAARGEYLCCYNQDTYFPKEYFTLIGDTVTPQAVWTTARKNHRVSIEHTCIRLRHSHGFSVPYVVDSLSDVMELNYLPGDGIIIPREIFEGSLDELIFDPRMRPRGEDVDLSFRIQDAGIPIYAVLATHSIHPDQVDLYRPSLRTLKLYFSNILANLDAYRNNGASFRTIGRLLAGSIVFPMLVYGREFPRPTKALLDYVELANNGSKYVLKKKENLLFMG
jgi:GT2 family glycosyltransferase